MGYQQIKRLAKRSGLNIPELLTLHRKNDPFFVGSPAQVAQAEWFAELWERFDYRTGVHLRRVHYTGLPPRSQRRSTMESRTSGPNG